MKKLVLFLLFLPLVFHGENNISIVGSIGGTVNTSTFGGAIYSIPLEIPKGVCNMQPEIGIIYNSQGGNSLLGYGWNISGISTITRTGSTLYHNGKMTAADFSCDDQFLLDGQRLILVGSSGNNYEYKTENDEFSKIVFQKENGYYSKCEVKLENGNIIQYGYTSNSKLMASDGNNVIKWMVSSISDRNGNTISYLYETSGANSDIYIKQISYTSNTTAGLNPQFVISFTYSTRFDDYHYYIAGNKVLCNRILTNIDILNGSNIIESYGFTYDSNTNRMYSLLKEISFSKGTDALNPTVIEWNTLDSDVNNNTLSSHVINSSVLEEVTFVGDFNGDGYSDLLTVPYKPLYGYSGYVTVKVFLNNRYGGFNSSPNYTLSLSQYLEWIHVFDINGDGRDDIVAQTKSLNPNPGVEEYCTGFTVYESLFSGGFTNAYSTSTEGRYYVKSGDFIGEGRTGLILIKLDISDDNDRDYIIYGYPALLHYDNGYSLDSFNDIIIDVGLIVSDDFDGNGLSEVLIFDSEYYTSLSFYKQNRAYRVTTTTERFQNHERASYYTGDFNNDGKADLFFDDINDDKCVALSTGTGFSDWIRISNTTLDNATLPNMVIYRCSLNYVSSDTSYGVSLSDIDGDGKTDIIFYNGNNRPIFYKDFKITDETTHTGNFRIEYCAENSDISFTNQYFTIGNFLGKDHIAFIALDPHNPAVTTDDETNIFSFPSTSERFSVNSITDGMGRTTEFEYDYLMPGVSGFYTFVDRPYVNDVKPFPLPMLALRSYSEHIGSNTYKTAFSYGNVLMHRTGRGFVNFENVNTANYINNICTSWESGWFEVNTTGFNALALPSYDSVYVYNNGVKTLSETTEYAFDNVKCNRQSTSGGNMLIVRPAMTYKKTKTYNPDSNGTLMSVEIVEYDYNYNNNKTYSNSYECTKILTGINGADCNSYSNCQYKSGTQYQYKTNDYSNWIINRKAEEKTITVFANKPAVSRRKNFEYLNNRPFLVSSMSDAPKATGNNTLTLLYNYQYDACGNVVTETVNAPYGTHNEAPITTNYAYSNYRLLTSKTKDPNGLVYKDQYTYDNYDRVIAHTGSNSLVTSYLYNNKFSTHVVTTAPDNTTTTEKTSWATETTMSPAGALYYKEVAATGKPTTKTFYDANGNAIRSVVLNHELDPVIVDACYNEKQLLTQKSNPYLTGDNPLWTTFQYDGLGRLINTIAPNGITVGNVYNGFTTTTTTTSGNSTRITEQTINYMGWITNNTDASGADVSYTYYSNGKIAAMTTSGGVTVEMGYDDAGNRTSLDDPDYGESTSVYDAFGRIVRQNTPRNDHYDYSYDVLGRITRKYIYGDGTTTLYTYNESTNKGTVASITHNGQILNYTYDTYCRLTSVDEIRRDTTYNTQYTYNNNSQLSSKKYPSGYHVYYEYYPNGTQKNIKDARGNTLWQTDDINANGQLLQATTGSRSVTTNTYDILTNRLTGSKTSNGIQNFAYTFDGFGNLTSRTDSLYSGKTETFTYDNLDRLTGITMNNLSSSIVYDALGRMTSKEKDGSIVFEYAQFSSTKPHATSSVQTMSQEFPDSQSIIYNSLDKVSRIAQGRKAVSFGYGYDAQRTWMSVIDTVTNITKTKNYVGNCEFTNDNGSKKVYTYLTGPYGVFAMVVTSGGVNNVYYIYKDHLGSWTTITDSVCNIVERRSFDAWGNARDPLTWSGLPARPLKFDRGFTGHEHLYDLGLINMNGRMYDPLMSAFLSPDNYMQDLTTQQGFNRYAYCMYNPLKYVDPSGELYFGWNGNSSYDYEQAERLVLSIRYNQYLEIMQPTWDRINYFSNSLWSQGDSYGGAIGGNGCHGGGAMGGGSQTPYVDVHDNGDGTYTVVGGVPNEDCSVYVVDDQGNRTYLGTMLTSNSFFDKYDVVVSGAIIYSNCIIGQLFLNDVINNTPNLYTYGFDDVYSGRHDKYYDFKSWGSKGLEDYELLCHYNRGMMIDYGDGIYIATARDIGNFAAGFIAAENGLSFTLTRILFDIYQDGIEPRVSRYAQNKGFLWGLRYFWPY